MVLEADKLGCAEEVIVIAAALSIQDPRERPSDQQAQADQLHARFADPDSDFVSFLNLWRYLKELQRPLSSNQFRKRCLAEHLHHLRVREWQDLVAQLREAAKGVGVRFNRTPAEPADIHRALLSGLLSHVGMKDDAGRDYTGARGARFAVFPGSGLFKKPPSWVMVAELVETTRLWGRVAARIDPADVEPLAGHLVKRTYSEPRWDPRRGSVVATERVTLYGLPIVTDRTVQYGRIDPVLSRELFIRRALVEGEWETRHAFVAENRAARGGGRGARAPGAAAGHPGRRRGAVRVLRRAGARRCRLGRRVRSLVAGRAAADPDLLTYTRACLSAPPTRSTSRRGRRPGARAS